MSKPRTVPCPYCGALYAVAATPTDAGASSIADAHAHGRDDPARSSERASTVASAHRCAACGTTLDDETRRETLARMGPWYIRSEAHPFMPGCSWEQLARFVASGVVTRATIVRGPTTRQLWMKARRVPGVAHLLGTCHACRAKVDPKSAACPACRASFGAPLERDSLGLTDGTEEIRAHAETADTASLSAFATNDELREGLHDEVRKRRSFGGASRGSGPATVGRAAHPHDGAHGAAQAPETGGSDDSDDADVARRGLPTWLLIGVPAGLATVAAVVIGSALAGLIPGWGFAPSDGSRSAQETETIAGAAGGAASEVRPSAPATPEPAMPPHATTEPATPRPTTSAPETPAPEAPAPPDAVPDPFATVDELILRARDSKVARGDRRRAVSDATAKLDSLAAASTAAPGVTPDAVETRRSRIDDARRRIDAEIFLRGEGEPS